MTRTVVLSAGLLFGAAILGAAASAAHADDWSKTYTVNGRADLHVQTDDGSVSVTSGDQNEIYVHVTTTHYTIGSSGVTIDQTQNGNSVDVHVRTPHFHWGFWGSSGTVHVDIRVPRNANLDVNTGDGNVDAQPVSGNIRITTGDGNINANGLHGQIYLHSGDGRIDSSGMDGSLQVDSGDGHIAIDGRFDWLKAQTGDGSIDASAAAGSKVGDGWNLHSGDGRITLRVASDLNAELDAHTGDGTVSVDVPITVSGSLNGSNVHGRLNAGGGPLRISSGDGSIHIEKI
jgi:DUF4097 and DUF4098 domain-containing protein YvlB